jgi:hypothetical protein
VASAARLPDAAVERQAMSCTVRRNDMDRRVMSELVRLYAA